MTAKSTNSIDGYMRYTEYMARKIVEIFVVGLCADCSHGYSGGRCKGIYIPMTLSQIIV